MDLKPFSKKPVKPGEPLTAQAWNDVGDAIDAAYQFLRSTMHTVRVKITTPGIDLEQVRVTATRAGGAPVEAVRPIPPDTDHVLTRLEPGAWIVTAEAHGYDSATTTVTIAEGGESSVELALKASGGFMPDLFGATLATARAALSAAKVSLVRLLDFNGRDLPPASAGENDDRLVLVQWPPAGSPLGAGGGARLVIAVPVQVEPAVEVPSLSSLSQTEAQKALEAIGLVLGKVTVVQRQ